MVKIAGYVRGKPAAAAELAWLPVYEAEALRRKLIRKSLDIFQIIGGYVKSGGTHVDGGAVDDGQTTLELIRLARNMGAAKWKRFVWQGFDVDHGHLVLKGAPAAAEAKAQVRELDGNGDGLRGSMRDTGPRSGVKWPLRSWKSGIKWAAAQLYAQSAKKHTAVRYYATSAKLAGRSYPGVGPVLIRRPKGFKIAATATYTAPDGSKHVRTKYGTWYALAYLAKVKPAKATAPAKPKPAPKPAPAKPITGKAVEHKGRRPLGPKVGRFMQLNVALLNTKGAATWLKRRTSLVKVIRANDPDVLFVQERPQSPGKWLDGRLGRLTQRVGNKARYIYLATGIKVHAWVLWTPKTKLPGQPKPVIFAAVNMGGLDVLLVNCHPQAGAKYATLRADWAVEVIGEAERRAARRGGIPIIFGGDFQGGEFAREAKARGYLRSIELAHTTTNAHLKSFNNWSTKAAEGYQMDQLILSPELAVGEHRLIWNGSVADHNRIRADIHRTA